MKFFSETERVLAPGGVLAIYGYSLPSCEMPHEDVKTVIDQVRLFSFFSAQKLPETAVKIKL